MQPAGERQQLRANECRHSGPAALLHNRVVFGRPFGELGAFQVPSHDPRRFPPTCLHLLCQLPSREERGSLGSTMPPDGEPVDPGSNPTSSPGLPPEGSWPNHFASPYLCFFSSLKLNSSGWLPCLSAGSGTCLGINAELWLNRFGALQGAARGPHSLPWVQGGGPVCPRTGYAAPKVTECRAHPAFRSLP